MNNPNYSIEALRMMDIWELPDTQQAPGFDLLLVKRAAEQAAELKALNPTQIRIFLEVIRRVQGSYITVTDVPVIRRFLKDAAPNVQAKIKTSTLTSPA